MVVLCVGCLLQQAQLYMLKWFTVLEGPVLKYEEQPSGCFCSVPLVKALCIKQRILLPKFPQSSSMSSQRLIAMQDYKCCISWCLEDQEIFLELLVVLH